MTDDIFDGLGDFEIAPTRAQQFRNVEIARVLNNMIWLCRLLQQDMGEEDVFVMESPI